jgi:hypothetical protein
VTLYPFHHCLESLVDHQVFQEDTKQNLVSSVDQQVSKGHMDLEHLLS